MSGRLVLAIVAATAALPAQSPAPPLVVSVDELPAAVWLQQPFEVVVRIAYDAAWFASSSVPLFQQALDVPLHVTVPWLQAAEDRAVELVAPAAAAVTARVAVGDRIESLLRGAPQDLDGRHYDVLLVRCRWLPLAPGSLAVAPLQVRYAFAERFQEDFLRGRQPVDRQEATVLSPLQKVEVRQLPDGAPPGFTGAVGEFTVAATVATDPVRVGEAFEVVLEVAGLGNLDRFAAPRPLRLPGFHVQGVVERRAPGCRRFALDVVALRQGVTALPPLPFVAFSPRAGSYTTLMTSPLPLRVEPAAGELSPRLQELVAADAREVARANALPAWVWSALVVALLVGGFAVRRWRQYRRRDAELQQLRELLVQASLEPAARLRVFEAVLALLGRDGISNGDVWSALAQRGVAAATVARARNAHAALDAARFGGAVPTTTELLAVVDQLARA